MQGVVELLAPCTMAACAFAAADRGVGCTRARCGRDALYPRLPGRPGKRGLIETIVVVFIHNKPVRLVNQLKVNGLSRLIARTQRIRQQPQ